MCFRPEKRVYHETKVIWDPFESMWNLGSACQRTRGSTNESNHRRMRVRSSKWTENGPTASPELPLLIPATSTRSSRQLWEELVASERVSSSRRLRHRLPRHPRLDLMLRRRRQKKQRRTRTLRMWTTSPSWSRGASSSRSARLRRARDSSRAGAATRADTCGARAECVRTIPDGDGSAGASGQSATRVNQREQCNRGEKQRTEFLEWTKRTVHKWNLAALQDPLELFGIHVERLLVALSLSVARGRLRSQRFCHFLVHSIAILPVHSSWAVYQWLHCHRQLNSWRPLQAIKGLRYSKNTVRQLVLLLF